jgi:hypothetical protein
MGGVNTGSLILQIFVFLAGTRRGPFVKIKNFIPVREYFLVLVGLLIDRRFRQKK